MPAHVNYAGILREIGLISPRRLIRTGVPRMVNRAGDLGATLTAGGRRLAGILVRLRHLEREDGCTGCACGCRIAPPAVI